MKYSVPVYAPDLTGNELKYVSECLTSTWISSKGRFIPLFESHFCKFVGCDFGASVSNGTVALHLALLALGISEGDEVILPTLTYVASANAVRYTGATPVFVDCDPQSWQMSPEDFMAKITSKTKAVMPVHLYGAACDMDAICSIAKRHNLFVIEDCAEAIGTLYKGRHVGVFGNIGTFSFFGNKTFTTGEGGIVVTNDQALQEKAVHLKGQGLAADREYWHDVVGYNYRMTNICAAIGVAQLERVQQFLDRKRELAEEFRTQLASAPLRFQSPLAGTTHSYWMVSFVCDDPADRDPLRGHLARAGIETRPVFYPLHTMPMYLKHSEQHPISEDIARRGVCLPSWPGLSRDSVNEICGSVLDYYRC